MLLGEVGTYLAARSTAVPFNTTLTRGTNLFEGDMGPGSGAATDPIAQVALAEYGGPAPEHDLGAETTRIEFARFQVRVRHSVYATGRLLIQQIAAALVAIGGNETLSSVKYLTINALQSNPTQMPRDENRRWHWTWNFEAWKEPSTS